jgi:hypothetical protein
LLDSSTGSVFSEGLTFLGRSIGIASKRRKKEKKERKERKKRKKEKMKEIIKLKYD